MNVESLPETGWGRIRSQCKNCPRAVGAEGEAFCEHPWRRLISRALDSGEQITYEHIARAWDMGASIGAVSLSTPRRSIEVSDTEMDMLPGTVIFKIN